MRTLASIQTIDDLQPIPNADAIEVASVLGWKVVVKKGEFTIGDKIVYLEIDSWVPTELAPFLSKGKEPREFEGIKGERLRTVKLRGQISQGLVLPLNEVLKVTGFDYKYHDNVGNDVTDDLNIKKYEAPIAANLAGKVRGNWPSFLQKTDETRIQAMPKLLEQLRGVTLIAHEKLDGSSMTVYNNEGDFGVCSRNLNLTETDDNSFWQVARKYDLRNKLKEGFCIQGELVGPGVQGNKYNLSELDLYIFNVFDIKRGTYLDTDAAKMFTCVMDLKWVPYITELEVTEDVTSDSLLTFAEGKSVLNPNQEREGLVWRPVTEMDLLRVGRVSFKTISNKFLLNGGE